MCRTYLTPGPPSAEIAVGSGAGAPGAHPEGRLSSGLGNPRPWSPQGQPRPVAGPGSCRGSGQGEDLRLPALLTGGWSLCASSQEAVNSELWAGVLEDTGCLSELSPDSRQWSPRHSRPVPRHFPLWSQHCFRGPRDTPFTPPSLLTENPTLTVTSICAAPEQMPKCPSTTGFHCKQGDSEPWPCPQGPGQPSVTLQRVLVSSSPAEERNDHISVPKMGTDMSGH